MDESIIIFGILGAIIFISVVMVLSSRSRIWRVYSKYLKVPNNAKITGEQLAFAARNILGYNDMELSLIDGKLSDAYLGGKRKILFLSEEVAHTPSLAAITIVAHEFGHAIQDHTNDHLYHFTRILNRITRITNHFVIPLILTGVGFLLFQYQMSVAYGLIAAGAGLFLLGATLKVLTIPMERDASRRALKFLKENNLLASGELGKARKLLAIASQTYMVALFDDLIIVRLIRRYRHKHGRYVRR